METPLSTQQAAVILGVSPRRVRALASAGLLQAVRLGRDWAVDPASVARRKANTPPPGNPRFT